MNRSWMPPFGIDELRGGDGPEPSSADLAEALAGARSLARLATESVAPSAGFADRVAATIATEPLPRPVPVMARAIRQGRLTAAVGALRDAWRVAWAGDRPLAIRAQAVALVLVAVLAVGSAGGFVAAGALGLLAPEPTLQVSPLTPSPTADPATTASATPSPSPSPEATPTPTASADPSAIRSPDGGTPRPGATPEETEEFDDTDEPDETDELDEAGSPEEANTPKPSDTPDPTGGDED